MKIYFGGADFPATRHTLLRAGVENVSLNFWGVYRYRGGDTEAIVQDLTKFKGVHLAFAGKDTAFNGPGEYSECVHQYFKFARRIPNLRIINEPFCTGISPLESREAAYEASLQGLPVHFQADSDTSETDDSIDSILIMSPQRADVRTKNMARSFLNADKKVHLGKVTSRYVYQGYKATSCDTIDWLAGEFQGYVFLFSRNNLKAYRRANPRLKQKMLQECKRIGADFSLIENRGLDELNYFNLRQWKTFQDYIEAKKYLEPEPAAEVKRPVLVPLPARVEAEVVSSEPKSLSVSKAGLMCDRCYVRKTCAAYRPASACSLTFAEVFETIPSPPEAIEKSALEILRLQYERINRASFFEKNGDGVLDVGLSEEIERYFAMLERLKKLSAPDSGETLTIFARGKAASELARAGGNSGGILQKLLRGE